MSGRDTILSKKIEDVAAVNGGTVIATNVFGGHFKYNGFIEQITVRASAGGGASFAVQIRGDETSTNIEDLYYSETGQSYDSFISVDKPFDTARAEDEDLSIWLNPVADGTFTVRVDFRIMGRIG